MRAVLFEDDKQFWFETLRVFGNASYGGADFGEVLATAERITPGDYDGWHDAWLATAERVGGEASRAQAAGHPVSARDGHLRASTYFRTAEFFLHDNPSDPRIAYAYDRSVEHFRAAARLFRPAIEPVTIPYGSIAGAALHGYFYRAGDGSEPRPTVMMHSGFDGSAEEVHFVGAWAAVERGYHVLSFDGPGQPSAIHRYGLPFRPDWEHAVAPVLDHLATRPEVDMTRVALLGQSLGGMLAPRAAAFEPRIAAVIAVDGVYDAAAAVTAMFPLDADELARRARAPRDDELDDMLRTAIETNPTARWAFGHGQYVMGADSPRRFLASYLDYHLRDGVAERIACPTLVCSAADDLFFEGQPQRLFEHLTCPKTLLEFTAEEGADAHCHVGAQRLALARIYDWLDDVLHP
ncbi:alpha/beta hydrolase family protein [Pseudonocardia acaciae]|uniref:alpha/beta hydrolase family protein n=1 Tax=Pseudonocardia acaciae TaxID=551276 RepID=UPI00048DAD88|nr:alpha/beta fold hydrolase [Pseudonocardia acaciae]